VLVISPDAKLWKLNVSVRSVPNAGTIEHMRWELKCRKALSFLSANLRDNLRIESLVSPSRHIRVTIAPKTDPSSFNILERVRLGIIVNASSCMTTAEPSVRPFSMRPASVSSSAFHNLALSGILLCLSSLRTFYLSDGVTAAVGWHVLLFERATPSRILLKPRVIDRERCLTGRGLALSFREYFRFRVQACRPQRRGCET